VIDEQASTSLLLNDLLVGISFKLRRGSRPERDCDRRPFSCNKLGKLWLGGRDSSLLKTGRAAMSERMRVEWLGVRDDLRHYLVHAA
jgi:hypothetical protein